MSEIARVLPNLIFNAILIVDLNILLLLSSNLNEQNYIIAMNNYEFSLFISTPTRITTNSKTLINNIVMRNRNVTI